MPNLASRYHLVRSPGLSAQKAGGQSETAAAMTAAQAICIPPPDLTAIAQLGASTHREYASRKETRFLGKQEHRGIGHHVGVWTIAQRMHAVEAFFHSARIRLFPNPLAQHRRPNRRRADCIDSNSLRGIIKRHGFGERNHRAFRPNVGSVVRLSNQSNHAGGVQNTPPPCSEKLKSKPRSPVNAL